MLMRAYPPSVRRITSRISRIRVQPIMKAAMLLDNRQVAILLLRRAAVAQKKGIMSYDNRA
jgi:hypothetical protein